jgi:ABC-type nitrate/sulfonate/bicarbonate transport system substrate-binding protein
MLSIVKAAALAAALATATSAVLAAPLKKVTLLQPVPAIDIRNAPWAVAHEMGWFAEAGLEVEVQVTKGASVLIQQLLNGTAQYGMPPPENVLSPTPSRHRSSSSSRPRPAARFRSPSRRMADQDPSRSPE